MSVNSSGAAEVTSAATSAASAGSGRFYFDSGLTMHAVTAGNEVKNLTAIQEQFQVKLIARENWVEISGEAAAVARCREFFAALANLFVLRKCRLEQRDFELITRSFRDRTEGDIPTLWKGRLPIGPKKKEIMPRSRHQLEYLNLMRQKEVVFGIGPAGTGKTYLAMAMAVAEYLQGNVSRIVLTRPARESGERLGFLPGSLEEKVSPYLRPLYDALYEMMDFDEAKELIARNVIEVAPLAFMRGRTLNGAFIILDEAQNTTSDQMLMFLTRMGFGSRCVITGDPQQSDLAPHEHSGLRKAMATLRRLPELGFVFFDTSDVVRHRLLEKIIDNYTADEVTNG